MIIFDRVVIENSTLVLLREVASLPISRNPPIEESKPKKDKPKRQQMRWLDGPFATEEVQYREQFDKDNHIA